jgi:hypothetical protein
MKVTNFLTTDDYSKSDPRIMWIIDNISSLYESKETICKVENGKVIIYGDILISDEYRELPYKIDEVYGSVIIENAYQHKHGELRSLKNFPTIIHGKFDCQMNPKLKTLEGGPEVVDGSYWCNGCSLTDLNGVAKQIGGHLLAFNNKITDISALKSSKINMNITLSESAYKDPYYKELQKQNKIVE